MKQKRVALKSDYDRIETKSGQVHVLYYTGLKSDYDRIETAH